MNPRELLFAAGQRAAQWYIDTGDCLFCNVDNATAERAADLAHERHCTFRGVSKTALQGFLKTLPELDTGDD